MQSANQSAHPSKRQQNQLEQSMQSFVRQRSPPNYKLAKVDQATSFQHCIKMAQEDLCMAEQSGRRSEQSLVAFVFEVDQAVGTEQSQARSIRMAEHQSLKVEKAVERH